MKPDAPSEASPKCTIERTAAADWIRAPGKSVLSWAAEFIRLGNLTLSVPSQARRQQKRGSLRRSWNDVTARERKRGVPQLKRLCFQVTRCHQRVPEGPAAPATPTSHTAGLAHQDLTPGSESLQLAQLHAEAENSSCFVTGTVCTDENELRQ
ncbi:hypothetical protein NDU88_007080 [Pleurodeles waltl]|uniref:Uncharacterized protein n=1 Tax=Pleurodeles waltl TaxID=8319 RepID=A0AAV7U050_PLEWA|nr:hypothetical protein NDU88_007080 [Pleurodeles waltl]